MMDYDDSSASTASDFMSPFAALRATFPTKSPKVQSETLPARQDASLLDAGMSPIPAAFDDDDDGDQADEEAIAPYRKALHESIDSSFSNERTALLGHRKRSKAHPSWDAEDVSQVTASTHATKASTPTCSWNVILYVLSGMQLACMALHDLYFWYLSYRLGLESSKSYSWRLPWLTPSDGTLTRFGALIPWKVIHGQAWRMVTSTFLSTSVVEYALICWAWHILRVGGSRPTLRWVPLYLMSAVTGQLWTIAWDPSSISGGSSWGTCGVLCAAGAAKARQRFLLFFVSIALTAVTSIDATGSSVGSIGSFAFGWAFYGVGQVLILRRDGETSSAPKGWIRMLSAIVLVSLWLVPLLWISSAGRYYPYQNQYVVG